jgi:hypothetical protein
MRSKCVLSWYAFFEYISFSMGTFTVGKLTIPLAKFRRDNTIAID